MLDKNYLKEKIRESFPDLRGTRFSVNDVSVQSFTEWSLLPFLIFQNTVDVHHRLIGLYLPEDCSIINMIPFYVMIGQYRKALEKVMREANYQNQSFQTDQKQVVYNGDICSISSVDFINRQLFFKSGRGQVFNLSFPETYKITWLKNSIDISDRIDSFELIDRARQGNIFTFPIAPKDNQYEGVIIFTNTSKFESLLRSVKVSGTDLRDQMNIQKVVFPSGDEAIRFVRFSKARTNNKPVSLLIARNDAFRAYEDILNSAKGSLNHIKTVIIDDFDELIGRWERCESTREELDWLKYNYFQKISDKQIKDLYFISRNSNIHIHGILKEAGISYSPWLLKPMEELILNNNKITDPPPELSVNNINDSKFEALCESLNTLTVKWKGLAQTNFCNGEILNPINSLYEVRTKLNSFFDPEALNDFMDDFLSNLYQLQKAWFAGGQDYNIIEETRRFVKEGFGAASELINFKLQFVAEMLQDKCKSESVAIVSDNSSAQDVEWLYDKLHSTFPNLRVTHFHKKDFFYFRKNETSLASIILYLTSDKKIIGAASGNVLGREQIFVLNKRSCFFTERYLKKIQQLQLEAGSTAAKYHLLNIKEPYDSSTSEMAGLIPVSYNRKQISQTQNEDESQVQETELHAVVNEIIREQHKIDPKGPSDRYLLFFEDGFLAQVPASRHFFLYEDDREGDDFDKLFVAVTELQAGDQVILTRRGNNVRDLLEQALRKNMDFSYSIEMDYKWRILINNHIKRSGMDKKFFCKKLFQNGFEIGPATVQNWIDGVTQRPDNFPNLLAALSGMGIINKDEIRAYDKHNSELKSILIRFVRTATRRLIARLNGSNLVEDEVFTDELLNDFINHIEIKRITSIYKL